MSEPKRQTAIRRLMLRLVFSLAVMAVLLGGVEGVLRLLPSTRNRGVNFREAPDGTWSYVGNDSGTSFASPKPPGVFRVLCFGGSATMGSIYNPRSTFSNHLRVMLESASKGAKVEVINCGKTMLASDGVLEIMRESFRFEPDLVIVYCGNNEMVDYTGLNPVKTPRLYALDGFLRRHTRIARMIPRMRMYLTTAAAGRFEFTEEKQFGIMQTLYPEDLRRVIVQVYLHNLEAMTRLCHDHQTPIILSTVASNQRDWSPQRSRYPESMSLETRLQLQKQVQQAEQLWRRGETDEAAGMVQAVLDQDPDHARAWFVQGQIELQKRKDQAAADALTKALDLDDMLISRTPSYQNQALLEEAPAWNAPVIDMARVFNLHSPHGITGEELIDDYCHPTLDGQLLIAATLAEAVTAKFPERFNSVTAQALLERKDEWLERLNLTPGYLALRVQEMAFYLAFAYDDLFINEHAVHLFQRIEKLNPDSTLPYLGIGLLRLRQGQDEAGRREFEGALARSPDHVRKMSELYFWRFINFSAPFLSVKSSPGASFLPILHDYMKVSNGTTLDRPGNLPLDLADRVYRWESATGRLQDLSREIHERLERRRSLLDGDSSGLVLFEAGKTSRFPRPVGMNLVRDGVYQSTSPDPYLVFPALNINPLRLGTITIVGRVLASRPQPLCLYWSDQAQQEFAERFKACSEQPSPAAGPTDTFVIDLADRPDWLLCSTVTALRLDPAEGKVTLELQKIELSP